MTNSVSRIRGTHTIREAKKINQTLKELLKTKEPYDRDVEFQRKNLRKRYLTLLLLHPYAKESKDAETHLWMQTSYAFISSYKYRITSIDHAIQANARQSTDNPKQAQNAKQHAPGPVEYRKLIKRFRQFLAEEEKFWIQLVLRMHRSFDVKEADDALATLGLISDTTIAPDVDGAQPPNPVFPEEPRSSLAPSTDAERESRLSLMSKAFICLGDLARYRELYNESGGRPRAGHEATAPARRGRIRKKGAHAIEAAPMARNYDKAQHRYEQARLLLPSEGNASHQLAILASYLPDALVALSHYYRALCVKHPFEPASENMVIHMTKTYQHWHASRQERERILASSPVTIQNQVDVFKNRLVVLHSLWRKNADREIKDQERRLYEDFHRLIGERNLPPDTICNVVITSQGALWKHRMIRETPTPRTKHHVTRSQEANTVLEWRILRHLLDVYIALLEVGKHELKDVPPMENIGNDLAQRITATFRRTLPALRIASKWLRANLNYVMQDPEFKAHYEKEKERSKGTKVPQKGEGKISRHSNHTVRFWKRYCLFMTALAQAFPESHLIPPSHPLEEDVDMRGFLPLKKVMGDGVSARDARRDKAHPNEEQLMRIYDLLSDAKSIVAEENSPLSFMGGEYILKDSVLEPRGDHQRNGQPSIDKTPPASQQNRMNEIRDSKPDAPPQEEDAMTEATSRTDDDIVKAAFTHVDLGGLDDEDEDDEEIVWNPKTTSPALSPLIQATPITPVKSFGPIGSNRAQDPTSPYATTSPQQQVMKTPIGSPRARAPTVSNVTAQDLLLNALTVGRKPGTGLVPPAPRDSPAMQPALLFGSDHQPVTASIWAASSDEQMLKFGGSPAIAQNPLSAQTSPRVFPHTINPSQELGHSNSTTGSIWSSQPINTNAPSASFHASGVSNQNPYTSPPNQNGLGLTSGGSMSFHHRRVSSFSNSPSASNLSPFYGHNGPLNDPAIQSASFHGAPQLPQQQQQSQQQFSMHLPNSSALLFQHLQHQQQRPMQRSDLNPDSSLRGYQQQGLRQAGGQGYPNSHQPQEIRTAPQPFGGMTSPLSSQPVWGRSG